LTLTANGGLLATASHKGTVIRVWDVSNSQNVYEFRRGVERASITCLAFSWDDQWLSCASDKGTTHIFYCDKNNSNNNSPNNNNDTTGDTSSSTRTSTTSSLLKTGSRLLSFSTSITSSGKKKQPQQPKSVCQIRGVPHPLSCAFIGDAPNLIAVAGWDADGNGVLLISEFASHQEARRVAYHVLVKNTAHQTESEEERRRRRARGWRPSLPDTVSSDQYNNNMLQISDEDADALERQFQTISTEDDFCEVIVGVRKEPTIDDNTPSMLLSPPSSTPITTKTTRTTPTTPPPEGIDVVSDDGDSYGVVMDDSNDDNDRNGSSSDCNPNTKNSNNSSRKAGGKETIGIVHNTNNNNSNNRNSLVSQNDQLSEKDSITNHDSVRTEPLEGDEDDEDDNVTEEEHVASASAETLVQ
jgi:hypothetical protein